MYRFILVSVFVPAATAAQSAQPPAGASRSPTDTRRLGVGRRGHAKAHSVALDITTGQEMDDLCPTAHNLAVCSVKEGHTRHGSAGRFGWW